MLAEEMSEDELFTILAHPIRRRILTYIFEYGFISFTTMSKEWKIATGTLYHHLKGLGTLIYQDEHSRYLLTEKGEQISAWFLRTESGKVKVEKICITNL